MKKVVALTLCLILSVAAHSAHAQTLSSQTVVPPAWEVPEYVTWLLEIAAGEVGYREGDHGYSKYGEWAGDPYAQWCAEYLCWCVDQVDQQHGTSLLNQVYPLYSGSNTGKNWFIKQGRYIARNGNLAGWGYQWMKGESEYIRTGTYIPQPGDWVFFTWTDTLDTDHVAMVEYCTQDQDGKVSIHVLEGNTPVAVKRAVYDLTYNRILGYGTVHDVADVTMRYGNSGEKVRQLQEQLIRLGYLEEGQATGTYGDNTLSAVTAFQSASDLKSNGIASQSTQQALAQAVDLAIDNDPATWQVVDD